MLKSELLDALRPAFAQISAMKIMYSEIPAHTKEVTKALSEELKAECAALDMAIETLKAADTEMQLRFSPELSRLASEYMAEMTGGRWNGVTLNRDFTAAAKAEDGAVAHEAEYLSLGTLDLMYLAVRLAVCELALPEGAVVWDVGAGTGSVTVEMALSAPRGQVYAIEQKPAAVETLRANVGLFHTDNVTVVPGTAPEACCELPAPTHAFLGGTSGNLQEIVDVILAKNPEARIVATAVTMESIAALTACAARFRRAEIVTLSVARARPVGHYHLLAAQNPVYVFTMDGGVTE